MGIYVYAANSVLLYCLLTVGYDVAGLFFKNRPFFFNTSADAVPFYVLTWTILLFHKPIRNYFEQQDFINFRRRILELAAIMLLISIPYGYYHVATKGLDAETTSYIVDREIARFASLSAFFFALYWGTYSQALTKKLDLIAVPKAIAVFVAVWSQTLVIGTLIFIVYFVVYFKLVDSKSSPAVSQKKIHWDLAAKAADEHEIAIVAKTCEPMDEYVKDKFRDQYYEKLRNGLVGPSSEPYFDYKY